MTVYKAAVIMLSRVIAMTSPMEAARGVARLSGFTLCLYATTISVASTNSNGMKNKNHYQRIH